MVERHQPPTTFNRLKKEQERESFPRYFPYNRGKWTFFDILFCLNNAKIIQLKLAHWLHILKYFSRKPFNRYLIYINCTNCSLVYISRYLNNLCNFSLLFPPTLYKRECIFLLAKSSSEVWLHYRWFQLCSYAHL